MRIKQSDLDAFLNASADRANAGGSSLLSAEERLQLDSAIEHVRNDLERGDGAALISALRELADAATDLAERLEKRE